MPSTKVDCLKRRVRQTDRALRRAQETMASIYKTVHPQHPDLTPRIFSIIGEMDGVRRAVLLFYLETWGGTTRHLWDSEDLSIILEQAQPVSDPKQQ